MERVGRLTKNTAALVTARVVTSGLTFLLAIIINRNLGAEKAGVYNYAFALYTIFQVIPDFGLGNISIRDVSQDNRRLHRYFTNIVSLRLLLGCLAFLLLVLTDLVTVALQGTGNVGGEKFWVVFTVSFCLLVEQPLSNSLAESFIALERLVLVAAVYLAMGVLRVAASIYLVTSGSSRVLIYLVAVYLLTIVYSVLQFYPLYRRMRRRIAAPSAEEAGLVAAESPAKAPDPRGESAMEALHDDVSFIRGAEKGEGCGGDPYSPAAGAGTVPTGPPSEEPKAVRRLGPFVFEPTLWRYLLQSAWPLAVVAAGVTLYAGMDVPILSWLRGDAEVGMYAAAGMFAKAFVFFTLALNMAVLPAISKVGGSHPERLGIIWEKLLKYAWLTVSLLVVVVPILARPILILQSQKDPFIDAWHVTWLTMAAMNFTFMTAISFPFFVVIDRQKILTRLVVLSLLLKGGLNLLTVPFLGYTGAALSVLVSEAVVFVVLAWMLSRELGYRPDLARLALPSLAVLGTLYGGGFVLYRVLAAWKETFMASLRYSLLISAALVVLYLTAGSVTGAFRRRELRELNELLTV